MEKIYTLMRNTGIANIAIGVTFITLGLVAGIISIFSGILLMKNKSDITF